MLYTWKYMTLIMNDSHMVSISQMRGFLKGSAGGILFCGVSRNEKYAWINDSLSRFSYFSLRKKDKSTVKQYLMRMTGLSDAQITRLIARKKKTGRVISGYTSSKRHSFPITYTPTDIARLIETDNVHRRLSGPATVAIFKRQYNIYADAGFERLKNISSAHIYNLRKTRQYQSHSSFFDKTKSVNVPIGERRKPDNLGKPGYLRVDTVHQGDYVDKNGNKKGVYYINIVDEVIQWQIVGAVEGISEAFLIPLLVELLKQFPFNIINFHSDNGSEYINKVVAKLLNTLLIKQTKSRPRHCNDNGLVETKNGAVIRKHMGYAYIPQKHAEKINVFYREYLNPYLNYHRPCGFATRRKDRKGKIRKVYDVYQTPFERFKTNSDASKFLKKGETIENLEKIALAMSDNECAKRMQEAKRILFKSLKS